MLKRLVSFTGRSLALVVGLASMPSMATAAGPVSGNGNSGSAMVSKDSTNIDFSAASIDGKMVAPSGFFLQGRNAQSMSQMVKLRSKFRSELRDSKSAVKALVH